MNGQSFGSSKEATLVNSLAIACEQLLIVCKIVQAKVNH
jgi:hypothetical protein